MSSDTPLPMPDNKDILERLRELQDRLERIVAHEAHREGIELPVSLPALETLNEAAAEITRLRSRIEGGGVDAVAGPIAEDENGDWSAEIQIAGGHYLLATVYGETRADAEATQQQIIAALTAAPLLGGEDGVIQADREAAARLIPDGPLGFRARVLAGREDGDSRVQAFRDYRRRLFAIPAVTDGGENHGKQ